MIDLHSHILPGLDDGAGNVEDSLAIARALVEDGISLVAGTPHVRDDYQTTPEAMESALAAVRGAAREAGIELDVRGGAEIALEHLEALDKVSLGRFGLGDQPRLVLVEYPYYGRPSSLAGVCARLRLDGIVPVIAHPERNAMIEERPLDLAGAVNEGAVIQLTAASVTGQLGRATADCARRLLDLELAHLVASDIHAPGRRDGLSRAAAAIGDGALAEWLTCAVPAALLAGEELPRRPPAARRRGSRFRGIVR